MAAAPLLFLFSKKETAQKASYGTFSCNSQIILLNNDAENTENLSKKPTNEPNYEEDTTLDKCWRHCERILMYFSAISHDKEMEELELENNNR